MNIEFIGKQQQEHANTLNTFTIFNEFNNFFGASVHRMQQVNQFGYQNFV